jgi:serine protease AprX
MLKEVIGGFLLAATLAGSEARAVQYAYQVTFTDKNNTPYSLSSPSAFLSSQALARRTAQGLPVDSTDIPVNRSYIDSVLHLTGGKLHNTSRWLNHCVILISDSILIHTLDGKAFIADKKLVAYYPGILHSPLHKGAGAAGPAQQTTAFDGTYYMDTWQQTLLVQGNYLHGNGHMGAGKLIAVLDAGFAGTDTHVGFDSLRNSGRIIDAYNFVLDTTYVYSYDTHGSRALSTMAGYVPGTYVGSAPLASYALYVTEDGNSEQPIELLNMLSASEHADSLGADIISSSLGYNIFTDFPSASFTFATDFDGKSTIAAQAANIATKKGMLFVASAGNEGGGPWNKILTPGDADSALTIGSVDLSGTPAATSGFGPNAAGQVKPDVCGMGEPAAVFQGSGYGSENGTSFSTPQIAGWAACLWATKPASTPYQVRQAIIKCASKYTSPDAHMGYGIPNFHCTADLLDVASMPPAQNGGSWVAVAPNPFTGDLQLSITADADESITIQLIDVAGRALFREENYFYKGYNSPAVISVPALPSGTYIMKVVSPTRQQVVRLEKL